HRTDRVCEYRRPRWRRLRRKFGAASRQHHGFYLLRIRYEREMARAAQRDRAARDASGSPSGPRYNLRARPVRRNPGRRASFWGGVAAGWRARCRRDRARHRVIWTLLGWRPDRDRERIGGGASRPDRHACCPPPITRSLPLSLLHHWRWPDLL